MRAGFFQVPVFLNQGDSSWQQKSWKSALICPVFAFPQRARSIAVNCAKKPVPTKRKLPAIVAIPLARSEHPAKS
jgi:hypothetical protein